MTKVVIGVLLLATVAVAGGVFYEWERVCCASPGVPLDQYWFGRIKAVHDRLEPQADRPHG